MRLFGKNIGIAMTGSFCTLAEMICEIEILIKEEGAVITPILSEMVDETDTRFGRAVGWKDELERIGCKPPILTIPQAEPIGPRGMFDVLVIAPCSGNTLAKLANGITDGSVLMAAKSHLRDQRPVVLSVSTNDGLGFNAKNLGILLNSKNIYMVPFGQDNPKEKANSLRSDVSKIAETVVEAMFGRQIQPVLLQYPSIMI